MGTVDAMPTRSGNSASGGKSVEAYLAALDHPQKATVERLRRAILAIDPRITEEVKWNAPSFKLDDHFATFKLHPPTQVQLVLHTGAKAEKPPRQLDLDASKLIKRAAPDRCILTLKPSETTGETEAEVVRLVRQWVEQQ